MKALKKIGGYLVNAMLAGVHWGLVLLCPVYCVLCLVTSFETPTLRRLKRDFAL